MGWGWGHEPGSVATPIGMCFRTVLRIGLNSGRGLVLKWILGWFYIIPNHRENVPLDYDRLNSLILTVSCPGENADSSRGR